MATCELKGGDALMKKLATMCHKPGAVKAGIPEGAVNQQGDSIPMYAAMNEFGGQIAVTDKMRGYLAAVKGVHLRKETGFISIPSRPFMRQTVSRCQKQWVSDLKKLLEAGRPVEQALEIMGGRMVDDMRETIKRGDFPPNRWPKKSGNPPLYDSGDMTAAIDYEVEA